MTLFLRLVVRAAACVLLVGGPVGAVVWGAYAASAAGEMPSAGGMFGILYYGVLVATPIAVIWSPLCAGIMLVILRRRPTVTQWTRSGAMAGAAAGFLSALPIAMLVGPDWNYGLSFLAAGILAGLSTGMMLALTTKTLLSSR